VPYLASFCRATRRGAGGSWTYPRILLSVSTFPFLKVFSVSSLSFSSPFFSRKMPHIHRGASESVFPFPSSELDPNFRTEGHPQVPLAALSPPWERTPRPLRTSCPERAPTSNCGFLTCSLLCLPRIPIWVTNRTEATFWLRQYTIHPPLFVFARL